MIIRCSTLDHSKKASVRAPKILAKHCDYRDPDEQVRDRLVIGLHDQQLRVADAE